MQILCDRKAEKLWLSQEKYIARVLSSFNMKRAKLVTTPLSNHFTLSKKSCPTIQEEREDMAAIPYASTFGSLMYAMVFTRTDITHVVSLISRFFSNTGRVHWEAVNWIFRYMRGTSKMYLRFGGSKPILKGFTNADMPGDLDDRKATSWFMFTFTGELFHGSPNYKNA